MESISIEVDQSSFSHNEVPAFVSTALVVVRNTQGLTSADTVNVPVLRCAESDTAEYCDSQYCSDATSDDDDTTLLGIACYCEADGVRTDPDVASCASSASMSDPVAGVVITNNTDVWVRVVKPHTSRVDVQFSNLGGVRLEWDLSILSNLEQLVWGVPNRNGSLDAGESWNIPLQISSEGLQARSTAYVTRFVLNGHSPEPTPVPESKSKQFNVHTVVSASPNAAASYANITNAASLTAGGIVKFDVTSVDGTGMAIQDAADVAYSADFVHSASSARVACGVSYDGSARQHKGTCQLQGLESGSFELKVKLGLDNIGGRTNLVMIERCPDSFELSDDGLSCTCPAGRYKLGNTCAHCADGTHKPALGVGKAECVVCQTADDTTKGLTSNAEHTACDACDDGYYRDEDAADGLCHTCPVGAQCTMNSDVASIVILPGHWRAGSESTEVRQCRYGDLSCPGNGTNQATGPDPYCGASYVGPLCSECHEDFFKSWDSVGTCRECATGKSHLPTIGLVGTVFAFGALFVVGVKKCRNKQNDGNLGEKKRLTFANVEKLYVLAKVKVFTLFLAAQARPSCAVPLIATS